jgi:hypothetical protein
MKMQISKKGELTTTQIIGIILLIAAFVILLLFLFKLNIQEGNEKQICQTSVMARASPIIPDNVVPLQCKTTYVCISNDKGKCEESLSNPTVTYKIKSQDQAYQIIADEFADCWWMFGEGQVNYAGKEVIPKLYCSLCSQIVFDKSMYEIFPSGKFSQKEIYSYMTKMDMSDNQTYSEYIYGTNDLKEISGGLAFDDVNIKERYYIGTGMSSEFGGTSVDIAGGAAGVALSFIPIAKVGLLIKPVIGILRINRPATAAGGAIGTHYLASVVSKLVGTQTVAPFMMQLNSDEFKALECKDLATSS